MIKVTLFYRDARKGNYSIEELFANISKAITGTFVLNSFYVIKDKLFATLFNAWRDKSDVKHITGDVNYLVYVLDGNKTIITLHDLGHFEMTMSGFKRYVYKLIWLSFPFKKARYISVISDFTKERLLSHFNISRDKVIVIHNPAPDFEFTPKVFNKARPKILQIGSGRNKNSHRLFEAIEGMDVELILIRNFDQGLAENLKQKNIKFSWHENISYQEVYHKYQECDILYFVSTYEGFGMPIIEANSVGRAVITANVASMPEIAADAAHIVDPYDTDAIRKGIQKLIEDEAYRERLISNGIENVKRFDKKKIAQQYMELYQRVYSINNSR